jgi:hypothetical protein
MMARRSLALAFAAVSMIAAGSAWPAASVSPTPEPVTVRLPYRTDVEVAAAGMRFRLRLEDVNDARCAAGTTCTPAGLAVNTIRVMLLSGPQPRLTVVALTTAGEPHAALGAVFSLDALEPPRTSGPVNPPSYVAVVRIAQQRSN